jgi:hypothetical protein
MSTPTLESLISAALDGRLDAASRILLNEQLRESAEARATWHRLCRVHATMHRMGEAGDLRDVSHQETSMPQSCSQKSRRWAMLAACAACVLIGLSVRSLFFSNPRHTPTVATLTTQQAIWEGLAPADGPLATDASYMLRSGFASLHFSSGVEVTLEAPCHFAISGPLEMSLDHGRAAVRVPEPVDEFTVRTPGGDLVDLGTEFGIAVGSDGRSPVVLTDVYVGEIEIRHTAEPLRLSAGNSRALLGKGANATCVDALDAQPISLADLHRSLPEKPRPALNDDNLALGKPVFAPSYLTRPHGSVFPPDNLTDGRTDDSGVPGDWSFWLAPDHQAGQFTVDLLESHSISRIELQNTRNRSIGDRGMKRFRILVSLDNQNFTPVMEGELAAIDLQQRTFPIETFSFPPVTARYVKIEGIDHYRSADRPMDDPHQGGGLNEIRIFAY